MALLVWQFGGVVARRRRLALRRRLRATGDSGRGRADADSPIIQPPSAAATSGSGAGVDAAFFGPPPRRGPRRTATSRCRSRACALINSRGSSMMPAAGGGMKPSTSSRRTGRPVKAVEDGRIARLFFSKAGGITDLPVRPVRTLLLLLRPPGPLRRAGFVKTTRSAAARSSATSAPPATPPRTPPTSISPFSG